MALLEVKNLKKYFNVSGGTLHAVDAVSFSVEEGKTLGIVGESGCGKSTLGKTLIRLTAPTSGEIYFNGREIAHMKPREFEAIRPDMQMIFQDPFSSVDPRMTVSQIIEEPLVIYKRCWSRAERIARVERLMDTVGLAKRLASSYPHELDGGRRQRIGIARALALEPKLIVCDEPVSALDVSIQAQILNLLQDLQESQNLTYMFITHDLSVVKHISNDICVMYLGRVVELSPSEELFSHTLHPYSQALLSALPVPSLDNRRKRILLKGELSSPIDPRPQCRFAPRCIHATERCFQSEPPLVEVSENHFVACHNIESIPVITNEETT